MIYNCFTFPSSRGAQEKIEIQTVELARDVETGQYRTYFHVYVINAVDLNIDKDTVSMSIFQHMQVLKAAMSGPYDHRWTDYRCLEDYLKNIYDVPVQFIVTPSRETRRQLTAQTS